MFNEWIVQQLKKLEDAELRLHQPHIEALRRVYGIEIAKAQVKREQVLSTK